MSRIQAEKASNETTGGLDNSALSVTILGRSTIQNWAYKAPLIRWEGPLVRARCILASSSPPSARLLHSFGLTVTASRVLFRCLQSRMTHVGIGVLFSFFFPLVLREVGRT
jgi:hypothetical protein